MAPHVARLLILALSGGVLLASQAPAGWPAFVAAYTEALPKHGIVGSGVAFVENGAIVARENYGLRDKAGTCRSTTTRSSTGRRSPKRSMPLASCSCATAG